LWTSHNDRYKSHDLPDGNTEYFLYQTLIGAWPIDLDRTRAYLQKAMREAKQQTSWVANNKVFEDALNGFIEGILGDREFVTMLETFVGRVLVAGRVNSLAQTLVKHVAPGVPDLYQGAELWDLSLVDPDNRRPVDYELRRGLLAEARGAEPETLMRKLADPTDAGLPKIALIHRCLALRRDQPDWFNENSAYVALPATGERAEHVIAFRRGDCVVAVAPRLTLKLGGDWRRKTVEIPGGRWTNRLTGKPVHSGDVRLDTLLAEFPVALLTREGK
jgi:(1->4)-alpha-D-glucan 1-alpha-D-glucosylmutase